MWSIPVTTPSQEWTQDELAGKIAKALTGLGLDASTEQTGGDIICIVIPRTDGGAIFWGTADFRWGAANMHEGGEQTSSVSTE